MPIYEYETEIPEKGCPQCRRGFEYLQDMNHRPLSQCPYCGNRVKKIISRCHAAIIDTAPEYTSLERKISEYEKSGRYSHAAEMADTYSHKTKDKLLKERALEDYKKAGYDLDPATHNDTF